MDDNIEEYKLSEPEEASAEIATPQDQEHVDPAAINSKNINWHKLIAPIAIVLAIPLVYGGFNFYNARKSRLEEQQKSQGQEVAAQQQESGLSVTSKKLDKSDVAPSSNNEQIEQVEQTQNIIQQKISTVEKDISSNNNQLSNLGESVSKEQQDVTSINQNINQLAVAMQQVLGEIQQLKTQKVNKHKKKKPVKIYPIYRIRAIVPGRAWLESDDGKAVTVRVGNELEGYGTVEVISPKDGMVLTSNGSYIQYGINDF